MIVDLKLRLRTVLDDGSYRSNIKHVTMTKCVTITFENGNVAVFDLYG